MSERFADLMGGLNEAFWAICLTLSGPGVGTHVKDILVGRRFRTTSASSSCVLPVGALIARGSQRQEFSQLR